MEKSLAYRWVVTLFFTVVGVAFVLSIAYLVAGNVAPDTYWGRRMTLPKTDDDRPGFSSTTFVLELDKGQSIGDRVFYFRGRDGDQILLEVVIPEIDRQYAYPYRINLGDARTGVEIAGLRLRMNALRPSFVSFKTLP